MIKRLGNIEPPGAIPVSNNPNVLKWLIANQLSSYERGVNPLSADIRKELVCVFGKQDVTRTYSGRRNKIWYLEYKGLTFIIYSAPTRGTSIEIVQPNVQRGDNETEIIEFLTELERLLFNSVRKKKLERIMNV